MKNLCDSIGVYRSGYYKWLNKEKAVQKIKIEKLALDIKRIFEESDKTLGVVCIQCALKRELDINISSKKVRRLMRIMNIYPEIRKKRSGCVRTVPEHMFENVISRDFVASKPNKKWFTDVSYLFYGNHQKAYISAIIDRYDLSIVSYVISTKNDNKLVMDTVKKALELNPKATPIIHSDRGFQYTSNEYNLLSKSSNFTISMSRVSKCLDNQLIESFWGVLKSEYYYRYKFQTLDSLKKGIEKYIEFYQNKRYVPKFNGLTPLKFRKIAM